MVKTLLYFNLAVPPFSLNVLRGWQFDKHDKPGAAALTSNFVWFETRGRFFAVADGYQSIGSDAFFHEKVSRGFSALGAERQVIWADPTSSQCPSTSIRVNGWLSSSRVLSKNGLAVFFEINAIELIIDILQRSTRRRDDGKSAAQCLHGGGRVCDPLGKSRRHEVDGVHCGSAVGGRTA